MLTPWFPADVLPVRRGVYECERRTNGPAWFRYFDGEGWVIGDCAPNDGFVTLFWMPSQHHAYPTRWRGLTAEGKQ